MTPLFKNEEAIQFSNRYAPWKMAELASQICSIICLGNDIQSIGNGFTLSQA